MLYADSHWYKDKHQTSKIGWKAVFRPWKARQSSAEWQHAEIFWIWEWCHLPETSAV